MRATVLQVVGLVGLPVAGALVEVSSTAAGVTAGVSAAVIYVGLAMDNATRRGER